MGPSGSGKTSLINVLSRRIREDAEGKDFNVRINDVQINDEISRRYGAFVPQEDIMPGTMSPR
jgi:ABC-type multidrug transport system ATPase subunit